MFRLDQKFLGGGFSSEKDKQLLLFFFHFFLLQAVLSLKSKQPQHCCREKIPLSVVA